MDKRKRAKVAEDVSASATFEKAYRNAGGFMFYNGKILLEKTQKSGEATTVPLSNFAPLIREEITRDDGNTKKLELLIDAIGEGGRSFPPLCVPASKVSSMGWVLEGWGVHANIHAGNGKKDLLRDAMQKASKSTVTQRTVYNHTGWRKIGAEWAYLYQGGAIGAEGLAVELEGSLEAYSLASTGAAEGAQASMEFLGVGALRVTAPLLCSMYLAPLFHFMHMAGCAPRFIPYIAGATGTKKTTLASLALSHFGNFSAQHPPASFADTVNSLRRKAFLLKDMPLLVDDFAPTADRLTGDKIAASAKDIANMWGDLRSRGRMDADMTMRKEELPRGMGIITGEDIPAIHEGGLARFYIVDMEKKDIGSLRALSALQAKARAGALVQAMRGYIEYLRPLADNLPGTLLASFERHREQAAQQLSTHARTAEAIACLLVGMEHMLAYWQAVGVNTNGLAEDIPTALMQNANTQQTDMESEKPILIFFENLREMLATGRAYVEGLPGTKQQGELVGWWDGREERVNLIHEAVYGAVVDFCKVQGVKFPISRPQLWKRMAAEGIQLTQGKEKTVGRRHGGIQVRVISITRAALLGEDEQQQAT